MPRIFAVLAATALFAAACNENAPVLPTEPRPPVGPAVVVTIASDVASLTAGSQATVTVTARLQDGSAVTDNPSVTINTNLGHFGLDEGGAPRKLVTVTLAGGAASVQFFAGNEAGTANLLAQLGTTVGRLNLAITQAPDAPLADFTFEVTGKRALFTDASTGAPSKWEWKFGEGTAASTIQNPAYDYSAPGTYTVTLTVENGGGKSAKSKFVTVAAPPPLVASFTSQVSGLSVLFTDTSAGQPESWEWNFGDNQPVSTERNPRHDYKGGGTYAVTLKVSGGGQTSTTTSFVTVGSLPPVADFTFQTIGLRALFIDTSVGAPTEWDWDFGDGKPHALVQNPSHDYEAAGTYTVTLTARNANGSAKKSQFVTVSQGDAPKASFTAQVVGLDAAFTDTSTGAPTQWEWNFGDTTPVDTRQNPTHHYTAAGTYTVSLKASNAAGASTVSQLITTVAAPTAAFTAAYASQDTLKVSFTDQSTGTPTAWQWNFGDCNLQPGCTSALRNPTYTYLEPGRYTVTLTVSNSAGQNAKQTVVRAGLPRADFSYSSTGANQITFTDLSTNAPTSYRWSFGDCVTCTSTDANPTHQYPGPGTYTVSLRVRNAADEDTISKSVTVPVP